MRSSWLCVVLGFVLVPAAFAAPRVEILRTPGGGIQPRAAVDAEGTLHLVYFQGKREGDLFYVTRPSGAEAFSAPLRVGSEAGSARNNGSIAVASLAVDGDGRPHVSWFHMRPPKFFYARLANDGTAFEKERVVVRENGEGVEAGAAVTAADDGTVFLAWHAGDLSEEAARHVYGLVSRDGGKSFGPERRLTAGGGVCACCGLDAAAVGGKLYVSYRAAGDGVDRDMRLLESTSEDAFENVRVHPWKLDACPVSTTALAGADAGKAWVAWETEGQLYLARSDRIARPAAVPGEAAARRKNPALAAGEDGGVLLVWGEGDGWRSGGKLHWRVFDAEGRPTEGHGSADEPVPDFSVATTAARADGFFVVVY